MGEECGSRRGTDSVETSAEQALKVFTVHGLMRLLAGTAATRVYGRAARAFRPRLHPGLGEGSELVATSVKIPTRVRLTPLKVLAGRSRTTLSDGCDGCSGG